MEKLSDDPWNDGHLYASPILKSGVKSVNNDPYGFLFGSTMPNHDKDTDSGESEELTTKI